jgi:hypothetical protein
MKTGLLPIFVAVAVALAIFAYYQVAWGADYEVVQTIRASYFTSPADGQIWCGSGYLSTSCAVAGYAGYAGGTIVKLNQPCTYASISSDISTSSSVTETAGSTSFGFVLYREFRDLPASISGNDPYTSQTLMTVSHVGQVTGKHYHKEARIAGVNASALGVAGGDNAYNRIGLYVVHPTWATNPTSVLTLIDFDCYATKSIAATPSVSVDFTEVTERVNQLAIAGLLLGSIVILGMGLKIWRP